MDAEVMVNVTGGEALILPLTSENLERAIEVFTSTSNDAMIALQCRPYEGPTILIKRKGTRSEVEFKPRETLRQQVAG